ncbi:Eco47II family restriction endonuclease [Trueperella pyogenes]|uniref:Eco47II family restriction endonuclease n=1 Tax=Trueperella pyogenes TaxID=1661 RepID=UPI00324E311A
MYDYGLDWLDQEQLFKVTKKWFGREPRMNSMVPPDPFALVVHAAKAGSSIASASEFEIVRKINKTISNNVGNWHQAVLGLGPYFETIPHSGVIDLRSVGDYRDPLFGKEVIVEVKNRFNTIKAADEKLLWDKLENLARSQGKVAYLFQIVPKDRKRFDQPWKVSGRSSRVYVRHCDGATAYAMVFKRENALHEIYEAFPAVLNEVLEAEIRFEMGDLDDLYRMSFVTDSESHKYN